jgi:hypothetical protein
MEWVLANPDENENWSEKTERTWSIVLPKLDSACILATTEKELALRM